MSVDEVGGLRAVGGTAAAASAGIRGLAEKIRSKQVKAFESTGDYTELQDVKQQPEYRMIARFVVDKPVRKWCLEGLLLQRRQSDQAAVAVIKGRLRQKKGPDAVWVAEAAQIGVVSKLIGVLHGQGMAERVIQDIVGQYLRKIRRHLLLVQAADDVRQLAERALSHLRAGPLLYCIAGSGGAVDVARRVVKEVYPAAFDYDVQSEQQAHRFSAFFVQLGPGERTTHRDEPPLEGYEVV